MADSQKKRKKTKNNKTDNQVVIPEENENAEGSDAVLKSDLLDDFLFHAANYVYVRRKLFITLAVVLVVIIVSVWGVVTYLSHQNELRNEELFQIEQIVYNDSLTEQQKADQALPLINGFLSQHEGTTQYTIALFYKAGLNARTGKSQEAESDYNQLLSILDPQSDLYFLASLNLSNVLRDENKPEQALELLQKAKTESVSDIILMEQAEIYMNNKQPEKAKEMLQILIKDYPMSSYANKARQLLEIL